MNIEIKKLPPVAPATPKPEAGMIVHYYGSQYMVVDVCDSIRKKLGDKTSDNVFTMNLLSGQVEVFTTNWEHLIESRRIRIIGRGKTLQVQMEEA